MSDDAIRTAIGLWEDAPMHVNCVENLPANLVAMTYATGQVKKEPPSSDAEQNDPSFIASANIPSRLEISDLYRADGKHPDGVT